MKTNKSWIDEKDSRLEPVAVTVREFCRITTLGRSKLYQEIANSNISILKAGRRTLIPYSEIQAYLDRLAQQGGAK